MLARKNYNIDLDTELGPYTWRGAIHYENKEFVRN